ncbi:hypothetical protein HNR73_000451 [Phytomonospora endophytica]|uniref:Uncharacterized protein n=1 Tax=Phytomonospora endophytica TaxID=714109 RepID=A0A841FIY5_9ACTN|nr:hypothetical protein [Phytomonospora endophytica]
MAPLCKAHAPMSPGWAPGVARIAGGGWGGLGWAAGRRSACLGGANETV